MELRELTGAAMMDCKKALIEAQGDFEQAKDILRKKGQAIVLKKMAREAKEGLIATASTQANKKTTSLAVLKMACETDFVARNEKFGQLQQELTEILLSQGQAWFQTQLEGGEIKQKLEKAVAEFGENILIPEFRVLSVQDDEALGYYVHTTKKLVSVVVGKAKPLVAAAVSENIFREVSLHIAAHRVEALDSSAIPKETLQKESEIYTQQLLEQGKTPEMAAKIVKGKLDKFVKEVCLSEQPFLKNPELSVQNWLKEQGKELKTEFSLTQFYKFAF